MMHLPDMFAVTDPAEVDLVLADLRLGCLVTRDSDGFFASHIPMMFDPATRTLTGHLAKANPHPKRCGDSSALAIFHGLNAYVSPNWYPSKFQDGKAVPTWNYEVVHVEGTVIWHDDSAWLLAHLAPLTDRHERNQAKPWEISDAPEDYLDRQLGLIIGMELQVRTVQVKRKLSQNRSEADRLGVIAGLLGGGDPVGQRVGRLMSSGRDIGSG
jgi:transcriptional regulator